MSHSRCGDRGQARRPDPPGREPARCIVLGSVGVDEVVPLEEPLRPGTHLQGRSGERRLGGGAANTGLMLAHAGHHVSLVTALGSDAPGDWILNELERWGLDTAAVVRLPGASTRSLVLLDPDGERTIVNLHRCLEPEPPARLLDLPGEALYVRSRELHLAPLLAARLSTTLVVAHVPPTEAGARPAQVLVASASDLGPRERRSPWKLGKSVAGDALRAFVLTRGAAGAESFSPGHRLRVAAPQVEAVDSTGAGDVFAAGLVHALAGGAPFSEALAKGCAWGAAAVTVPGLPSREAIRALAG
jgi:sugar/nucleoside kinase (ribokinase family)